MSLSGASLEKSPGGPPQRPSWTPSNLRLLLLAAAVLIVGGAVYLAVTRADALLLDLAALAQCF